LCKAAAAFKSKRATLARHVGGSSLAIFLPTCTCTVIPTCPCGDVPPPTSDGSCDSSVRSSAAPWPWAADRNTPLHGGPAGMRKPRHENEPAKAAAWDHRGGCQSTRDGRHAPSWCGHDGHVGGGRPSSAAPNRPLRAAVAKDAAAQRVATRSAADSRSGGQTTTQRRRRRRRRRPRRRWRRSGHTVSGPASSRQRGPGRSPTGHTRRPVCLSCGCVNLPTPLGGAQCGAPTPPPTRRWRAAAAPTGDPGLAPPPPPGAPPPGRCAGAHGIRGTLCRQRPGPAATRRAAVPAATVGGGDGAPQLPTTGGESPGGCHANARPVRVARVRSDARRGHASPRREEADPTTAR